MTDPAALDQISDLLNAGDGSTATTSIRLPTNLRNAATLAAQHLGCAQSVNMLTAPALREALETELMSAALDLHYEERPTARPSLAEVALALAEQDGSPLADRPDIIEQAATDV